MRHGLSVVAGAVVTSAVFATEHFTGKPLSWNAAESIIGASVVLATFLSWREKARALSDAQTQANDLRGQLVATRNDLAEARTRSRWQFTARIDHVQIFSQTDTETREVFVRAALYVIIRNLGEDSLAENWRVHAQDRQRNPLAVDIFGLGDLTFDVPFVNNQTIRYREEHCINIRARSAIKRGDGADGVLCCRIRGVANAGDVDPETVRVTFDDVNGNEWSTDAWDGVNTITTPTYYYAGLPRPNPSE